MLHQSIFIIFIIIWIAVYQIHFKEFFCFWFTLVNFDLQFHIYSQQFICYVMLCYCNILWTVRYYSQSVLFKPIKLYQFISMCHTFKFNFSNYCRFKKEISFCSNQVQWLNLRLDDQIQQKESIPLFFLNKKLLYTKFEQAFYVISLFTFTHRQNWMWSSWYKI